MINPLKSLRDAVIRFRRSRGFGVHSPFAYGFITQVLRCRYRFYCWDNLEPEVRSSGGIRWNDARALFRTLNQFRPARVYISPGSTGIIEKIVRAWSGKCEILYNPSGAMFHIVSGEEFTAVSAGDQSDDGMIYFCLNVAGNHGWDSLLKSMTRGQTFTNSTTGIAVCDHKLPRHHFEISY